MTETALYGYQRKDGRYGVRNYVAVISTVHCANAVAQRIAAAADAPCITHEHGCTEAAEIGRAHV